MSDSNPNPEVAELKADSAIVVLSHDKKHVFCFRFVEPTKLITAYDVMVARVVEILTTGEYQCNSAGIVALMIHVQKMIVASYNKQQLEKDNSNEQQPPTDSN